MQKDKDQSSNEDIKRTLKDLESLVDLNKDYVVVKDENQFTYNIVTHCVYINQEKLGQVPKHLQKSAKYIVDWVSHSYPYEPTHVLFDTNVTNGNPRAVFFSHIGQLAIPYPGSPHKHVYHEKLFTAPEVNMFSVKVLKDEDVLEKFIDIAMSEEEDNVTLLQTMVELYIPAARNVFLE